MIDYQSQFVAFTANTAVTNGQRVSLVSGGVDPASTDGNFGAIGIATQDIAAGAKGVVRLAGSGAYSGIAEAQINVGDSVYPDAANYNASAQSNNDSVGVAMTASAAGGRFTFAALGRGL